MAFEDLAPLTPDALVLQAPCAECGCGSVCHWDDLNLPPEGSTPEAWALMATWVPCQRCPCKGYTIRNSSDSRNT